MTRTGRESLSGHILILGESRYRDIVLAELSETELTERKTVVAVSEGEAEGQSAVGGMTIRFVRGDPEDPRTLESVSAADAGAILALSAGGASGDERVARIARALIACTRKAAILPSGSPIAITVVTETEEWQRRIGSDGGSLVQPVCYTTLLARIVALASRQRNLSTLLRELFTFRGNDLYIVPAGDLAGMSYAGSLRAFKTACVAGIMREGKVTLNPDMATVLRKGDSLVLIAEDSRSIARNPAILPAPDGTCIAEPGASPAEEESILFLGWNPLCPAIADALERSTDGNLRVTVFAPSPPETSAPPEAPLRPGAGLTTERVDLDDPAALARIPWQYFENVIIPGDGSGDDRAAIALYQRVRAELLASGFENNLTTVLLAPLSGETGGDGGRFVSAEIVFRIVAEDGAKIRLKPAENYVKPGAEADFYTILEAARRRNETAIGYAFAEDGTIALNPPKTKAMRFYHLDRIVVLAGQKSAL
jgi:Trk K+ transport system NAD-binding subunit